MNEINRDKLFEHFISKIETGFQIFAILDSARRPEIAWKPYEFLSEWVSLYKGEPEESLVDVAPYLINLSKGDKPNLDLVKWISNDCFGDSCSIFIYSQANIETLLKHFQQFLIVTDESSKAFYFRFYDPRVLRIYLPTCNEDELKTFFGPTDMFVMENEELTSLIEFSVVNNKLLTNSSLIN